MKYKGRIITSLEPNATTSSASGIWLRQEQMQASQSLSWPIFISRNNYNDPYFSSVVLLLHMNGINGSTAFIDNSSYSLTPSSKVGSVQLSNSFYKFGTSALFPSSDNVSVSGSASPSYFYYPSTASLALGTGDFTIEFWAYPLNTSQNSGVFQLSTNSGYFSSSPAGQLDAQFYNGYINFGYNGAFNVGLNVASNAFNANTWYHIAMSRTNGILYFFINGTIVQSVSDTTNYTGTYLVIGGMFGSQYSFYGYIDDFRITKGVARYISNFTIPATEFPDNPIGPSTKLTGVTYSQSSVFSGTNAAEYTYMNDNNANGGSNNAEAGTNSEVNSFIKADCGSIKYIDRVIIGYDYNTNLPGGWGPSYLNGLYLQTSTDNSTWTTVTTTPAYASTGSVNGLAAINVGTSARYIRLYNPSGYTMTLEFQVWGY